MSENSPESDAFFTNILYRLTDTEICKCKRLVLKK